MVVESGQRMEVTRLVAGSRRAGQEKDYMRQFGWHRRQHGGVAAYILELKQIREILFWVAAGRRACKVWETSVPSGAGSQGTGLLLDLMSWLILRLFALIVFGGQDMMSWRPCIAHICHVSFARHPCIVVFHLTSFKTQDSP